MKNNLNSRKTWLKLISVVFSFFIWLYVVSTAEIEKDKSILLEYIVPDGYSLADEYVKSLSVTVRGPRLLVRKYLQRDEKLEIQLTKQFRTGKNKYSYNLNGLLPRATFGVELLSLSPKNLEVRVEKTAFKKVPVKLNIPKTLQESLSVDAFKVTPRDIDISGPSSKVKAIQSVHTENMDDFELLDGKNQEIELINPSNLIGMSDTSVVIAYTVKSTVSEFTFKKIPIIFQSTKLIASVEKRFVDLVLKGPRNILEKFDAKGLDVIASVRASSKKTQTIELFVNLPQGVELVSMMPNQIKITLE